MDPSRLQEDFRFQAMKVMTAHLYPASKGRFSLPGPECGPHLWAMESARSRLIIVSASASGLNSTQAMKAPVRPILLFNEHPLRNRGWDCLQNVIDGP